MIKRLSLKDARAAGLLSEINRQFLHPRGLALQVDLTEDGNETINSLWDYRDDPEGIVYCLDDPEFKKRLQEKKKSFESFAPLIRDSPQSID